MPKQSNTFLSKWLSNSKETNRKSDVDDTQKLNKNDQDIVKEIPTVENSAHEDTNTPYSRYVPSQNFKFPKNNQKRSCLRCWFDKFSWLHYDVTRDVVLCSVCISLFKESGSKTDSTEMAFIQNGFHNWTNAMTKFKAHERSDYHRKSLDYINSKNNTPQVLSLLSEVCKNDQMDARQFLRVMTSSIRYLAGSGQAFQGDKSDEGNLVDLIKERIPDVPAVGHWMEKRDKWLSHDIQNEIIELMAHTVQKDLVSEIKFSPFFGIVADGTTDGSGHEQFSLSVRYVDVASLKIKEEFIGLYNPPDTRAETLFIVIKDMLLRLGLDISLLRGHCFDGAANMSGAISGVQQRITLENPKSIYFYCSNHAIDLSLQEIGRNCSLVSDALLLVRSVSNVILDSAKRKDIYKNIVLPCNNIDGQDSSFTNLLSLCPTRWAVRVNAMNRFIDNYLRIIKSLDLIIADSNTQAERKSVLRGYLNSLKIFETLFGIVASKHVFNPVEILAKSFQDKQLTVTGSWEAVKVLKNTLMNWRADDTIFEKLWKETEDLADKYELDEPQEPRRVRKPPKRLEQTTTPSDSVTLTAKSNLRKEFNAVLDRLIVEIDNKYKQPQIEKIIKMESLLLNAANGKVFDLSEVKNSLGNHITDFEIDRFHAQLMMFSTIFKADDSRNNVTEVAAVMSRQPMEVRSLFKEVEKLVIILLTIPASEATAERSFSAVRRILLWNRCKMTQKRLCHLVFLHVHKKKTQELNLQIIMKMFINKTVERMKVFGCP